MITNLTSFRELNPESLVIYPNPNILVHAKKEVRLIWLMDSPWANLVKDTVAVLTGQK